MTDEEHTEWWAANLALPWPKSRAKTPCEDCTPLFSVTMLAVGKCDGVPASAKPPPTPEQIVLRAKWRARDAARRKAK